MHRSCNECQASFEITDADYAFYDKVSPVIAGRKFAIPPPVECYDCRQQRRLAMRNEHRLYARTCDLCKRSIISIYSQDKKVTVYCPACWWGDSWDALSYGREFDFNRTFFDQFKEMFMTIPKISRITLGDDINSDYTHDGARLKNCYLIFDGELAEDCYYGELYSSIRNCCDFLYTRECELCYECIHCNKCFDLRNSRYCNNSSSSSFLLDCNSCKNCIACANLVQKEYCVFNQQYSKDEFEKRKEDMHLGTASGVKNLRKQAEEFFLTVPKRATRTLMSEDVTGDNLIECKNTLDSFDCMGMRDCRYCTNCMLGAVDCYDVDAWGTETALAYNCAYIGAGAQQLLGCYYVGFGTANVSYCVFCLQSGQGNLFGCEAVKKEGHCILNKQYSKQEYEQLAPKIIEHMQKSGEWGQFFPLTMSLFAYNETVANDYYPLTKEETLNRGLQWKESDDRVPDVERVIDASSLPDSINDIPDDILNWAIKCSVSGRPYKIQKAELEYYRKMQIPIPREHFEIRHAKRLALRPPRKLWDRQCAKCQKPLQTTYAPERPEIVYCESCYLQTVY